MTKAPLLVIAAGGTGGHMFPAQALAETLLRNAAGRCGSRPTTRGARYAGGFPRRASKIDPRRPPPRFARGGAAAKLAMPRSGSAGGILSAIFGAMLTNRPAVGRGLRRLPDDPRALGGLRSSHACRRMIHEQNGVLGRVNHAFARRVERGRLRGLAHRVCPAGVDRVHHAGNPVRKAVLEARKRPPTSCPLATARIRLVVIGGSQGARILSDVVPQADFGTSARATILLRGSASRTRRASEDEERVTRLLPQGRGHRRPRSNRSSTTSPRRFTEAQLVISRAGRLLCRRPLGHRAALDPHPLRRRHRRPPDGQRTCNLVEAGAAILIPEKRSLRPKRSQRRNHLEFSTDPEAAELLAGNALTAGIGRTPANASRIW